jgi:hypothetical protein
MVKPISPSEATALKKSALPDVVINCWNNMIAKNWNGYSSTVYQNDAAQLICTAMDCTREVVFSNNWLGVEDIYRAEGWKVHYDKPGFNESYEAKFEFSKKKSED